ncbi:ArsC family reductase [Paraglaciecola aquimarina]|uniref:ArsC family reductase n=1 Tax=Paraglaciecola aquimarina TaxID=1235557 RepID=A0ABU3SZP8_9ALTE|nr:ArsC family reductase [Paraglaciecola aquimarina]MDU0355488.1 ArsC family reductase [Paraglaciecola aquimarina]
MTTLYGIKNCDTIKKAKTWLTNNNIEFTFHDYRQDGLDANWLATTEQHLGWESLLNKRGTTYRQLPEEQKQTIDRTSALALMLEQPAMIKRPVLIHNGQYFVGFKAEQYQEILL